MLAETLLNPAPRMRIPTGDPADVQMAMIKALRRLELRRAAERVAAAYNQDWMRGMRMEPRAS